LKIHRGPSQPADVQFLIPQGIVSLLSDTFPDWSFLYPGNFSKVMEHLALASGPREAHPAPRILIRANTDDWNTIPHVLTAGYTVPG
jgi:hypothetical protein